MTDTKIRYFYQLCNYRPLLARFDMQEPIRRAKKELHNPRVVQPIFIRKDITEGKLQM